MEKRDAEFLIEHRANVNAQDQRGQTPLMIATMNGHKEVVELLIEKRADIELRENHGGRHSERPFLTTKKT